MTKTTLSPEFLAKCEAVTAKRPKTVIDHILEHGHITTQELKDLYGYNHPSRAIRDVKEQGIPLEMYRIAGSDGRKIGAYRFGEEKKVRYTLSAGRTAFAKALREKLIELNSSKCSIYLEKFEPTALQIDHRIPYEVAGDDPKEMGNPAAYMLLCSSANRAKSWACEHCKNWKETKNPKICLACYWASPEKYNHVAMEEVRRLDLIWNGKEVEDYEKLKKASIIAEQPIAYFVKQILKKEVK